MARCFEAKKSKAGKKIKCGRCSELIKPGEQYFYFSVGFRGPKSYRCFRHRPKQSELCGSKMSGAYAAIEGLEAAISEAQDLSTISSALESAADDIEQVRDEYQESYDNLPENFQNNEQGETIQSNIDGLEDFANELLNAQSEVDSMESDLTDPDDDTAEQENQSVIDVAKEKAKEAIQSFSL
jgi:hypothetical protein